MSIASVRNFFEKQGRANEIREFAASSATVELAGQALGVDAARIAKTLSFYNKAGGCILVVAAGDAKIDNAKFKRQFSQKAKMLAAEDVEKFTGHPVGGVCPFANPENAAVYLDVSLKRFATVFPACGNAHSAIELSCEELQSLSGAEAWVDVCKNL